MRSGKALTTASFLGALTLLATPAVAQEEQAQDTLDAEREEMAAEQADADTTRADTTEATPYARADDTWISLSGTVQRVSMDEFVLDYGEGVITVEMDDWNADADAYKVVEGDRVTVSGIVDDDLFETTSIEASSVYVEGLNTYFYALGVDEEDTFVTITATADLSDIILQGTVTEVSDEEFTLETGLREITVETEDMTYDPLDEEGFQQIEIGDRVMVVGESDDDFLEGREIVAETITTLER